MKPETLCCETLGTAVKRIAIISMLFTGTLIFLEIFLIQKYGWPVVEEVNSDLEDISEISEIDIILQNDPLNFTRYSNSIADNSNLNYVQLFKIDTERFKWVASFWFTTWTIDVILSISLYIGAHKRNEIICLLWFYIRCAILLTRVLCLIIYILAGITLLRKIPVIIIFLFRAYCLWTVSKFIDQISNSKNKFIDEKISQNPNGASEISGFTNIFLLNQLNNKLPVKFIHENENNKKCQFFA